MNIKFKAKVKKYGDWEYQSKWCKNCIPLDKKPGDIVEGYHTEHYGRHYILLSEGKESEGFTGGEIYFTYWYRVDPDTVSPIFDTDIDISCFSEACQNKIKSSLLMGEKLMEKIYER